MMLKRSLLAVSVAALVMVGCKKKDEAADAAPPASEAATQTAPAASADANAAPAAPTPTASAATFDINSYPISDKPLGEWPYVQLPAGYRFDTDKLGENTKDLARVPVWTGDALVWVEGKTFETKFYTNDGKTYSKFELGKGIAQSVEALGGKRVSNKIFDESFANAHEEELKSFLKEFDKIDDAYRYYSEGTDTYLIRRADKAIWVVTFLDESNNASMMVAEGPLPVAEAK